MKELDLETIRHALRTARENGYEVVRIRSGAEAFRGTLDLTRPESATPELVFMPEEMDADPEETEGQAFEEIRAMAVGYFAPGSLFEVSASVNKGDVVGSIRALGISNDVTSSVSGKITEVLVGEGDPVQFGQALARVEV